MNGFNGMTRTGSRAGRVLRLAIVASALAPHVGLAQGGRSSGANGEEEPGGTKWACYVPNSGTVYRVRTSDTRNACASQNHILFSFGGGGETGPAGPMGPVGETGAVGPIGPAGPAGAQGPTGATGPAGLDGGIGPQGLPGATGPSGLDGGIGPQGLPGATGPAGLNGGIGPQGLPGATGPAGLDGGIGPQGLQGIRGDPGPTGATGATGPAGPPGPTGPPGPKGDLGLMGPPGMSGYQLVRVSIPPSGSPEKGATAFCPAPKRAVGGGVTIIGTVSGSPMPITVATVPDPGGGGWFGKAGGNGNPNWGMDIWAVCVTVAP